ncbi:hypothetical protein [Wolbachia endosymbiont of Chironomus riparius]|uniref:hypothetical protein n=1 Tax=Wolbachia endosymbiont of Chironomus riparius TaxID=2883238 RepID=UPI0020A1617C|nr:hypothetical protein [Wolbachia endosymbiont of Chironomus riparius]
MSTNDNKKDLMNKNQTKEASHKNVGLLELLKNKIKNIANTLGICKQDHTCKNTKTKKEALPTTRKTPEDLNKTAIKKIEKKPSSAPTKKEKKDPQIFN